MPTPYYNLESIIVAAKNRQISYHGRKVSVNISSLGYTLDDVAHCIEQLQPKHYQKTVHYPEQNRIFDCYVTKFSPKPN